MKVDDRMLNIIEDHESIIQVVEGMVNAIDNRLEMPNFIPVLHDTLITDHLCKICEKLKEIPR